MKRILEYKIEPEFDGERLMAVLKRHFKMSTVLIKEQRTYADGFLLNGEHIRTIDAVHTGDILTITLHDKASDNISPVNIPIDIVYEDEDILIVNKSPNMPTHISVGNYENSLANAVMYHYAQNGEEHLFRAVNRLDADTSGLMTIAKNSYAHARLADEIQSGVLTRRYMCIAQGDIEYNGTVNAPIARRTGSAIERCVSDSGQRAVTHYEVLERYGDYTLLRMTLETGRTHQIRVHMAHIGHPLAGDWLYGTENHKLAQRQMLHSCYLRLIHPITGKIMEWNIKMADDMENFVRKVTQKH